MERLAGKIALVTGAGRGIGAAIAQAFAAEGAYVHVTDLQDDWGQGVVDSLGGRGRYVPLDVREEGQWQEAMAIAQAEQGGIHCLVNKATVRNHTKTVALYCTDQGLPIRCNSIHPAAILTPMGEPMLGDGPIAPPPWRSLWRIVPCGALVSRRRWRRSPYSWPPMR